MPDKNPERRDRYRLALFGTKFLGNLAFLFCYNATYFVTSQSERLSANCTPTSDYAESTMAHIPLVMPRNFATNHMRIPANQSLSNANRTRE